MHASNVQNDDVADQIHSFPLSPSTPQGKDGAGVVEEVGSRVSGLKKGDRVFSTIFSSGSLAEYGVADANRVFALPENVSFDEGAALGIPYFTAFRALFHRGDEDWRESLTSDRSL